MYLLNHHQLKLIIIIVIHACMHILLKSSDFHYLHTKMFTLNDSIKREKS